MTTLHCRGGWINEYLDYTRFSESPEIFHRWTAVSIIASILGRNVWWDLGYSNIYPNLYIVLVARSAGLKKTAACEIGIDLLYNVPIDVKIIADKLTNEYLLKTLGLMNEKEGKDAVAIVYAEELSVFIGPNALSSGLIAALTKLYNCPAYFPYGTKTSGSYMLVNCCLNILGASTPEWLRLCMPADSLGGGFTGRIVFITAVEKERSIAHPKHLMESTNTTKESIKNQKLRLIKDLQAFSTLKGEFVLDREGEDWYHAWYENRELEENKDLRLSSYNERRHITLMKLSMILAVNKGRKYKIMLEDLQQALAWMKEVEEDMIYAYEGITYSDSTKHVDRLIRQIKQQKVVSHSELLRKNSFHMNSEEFGRVIRTLIDAETIEEVFSGRRRMYRMKGGDENE